MIQDYDIVVVGGGPSGLASALLLARHGRRVLLLEKAPRLGGSLARFRLGGVPYDTGVHFVGGVRDDGILHNMLAVLGVREALQTVDLDATAMLRFVFEREGADFALPTGVARMEAYLCAQFPQEADGIRRYFALLLKVRRESTGMDLTRLHEPIRPVPEDFQTLDQVLDATVRNPLLRTILAGLCLCYGTPPREISFATHARISYDFYQSTAKLAGGGTGLVEAFAARFRELGVEVRCGCWLERCDEVRDKLVGRFVLNDGSEVRAGAALLTIHPQAILPLLPPGQVSGAFRERVQDFVPANGFFTLFGEIPASLTAAGANSIVSLFPCSDCNQLLSPQLGLDSAVVLLNGTEAVGGTTHQTVTAFEPSFIPQVAAWADSRVGRRPAAYYAYKREREAAIHRRMAAFDPAAYGTALTIRDSASMLTFRDYLHSPDGTAYGIRQRVGQFNLLGRLPLKNLFVAGQSALLPGLAGAVMSGFLVAKMILGNQWKAVGGRKERL